jgi:alpha-L-arabinofuranosidase
VQALVILGESVCVLSIFHEKNDIHTTINGIAPGTEVTVFTISGQDVSVTNMNWEEKVGVQETTWVADGTYTFPHHSFTMLRWT